MDRTYYGNASTFPLVPPQSLYLMLDGSWQLLDAIKFGANMKFPWCDSFVEPLI